MIYLCSKELQNIFQTINTPFTKERERGGEGEGGGRGEVKMYVLVTWNTQQFECLHNYRDKGRVLSAHTCLHLKN